MNPLPGAIIPPGTVYDWTVTTNGNVSGEVNGAGESVFSATLFNNTSVAESVEYTIIPIAPGPCPGEAFVIPVTVYPGIQVPDQLGFVCSGEDFTLNLVDNPPEVILPDGVTFTWSAADSPNVTNEQPGTAESDFSQTLFLDEDVFAQTVQFDVDVVAGAGCEGASFAVDLFVHDLDPGLIQGLNLCV